MALRSPAKKPVQSDDPAAVRLAAMTLLARRDFAGGELRHKLTQRGFADATVRAVLAEMAAAGQLNEARYVESQVRAHVGRGQGPVRIRADLRRNGVPEALIEAGLDAVDWLQLARQVRRAKFGGAAPGDWAGKARQARFLQYRGFSADHIRAATGADPDFE
jgi:regulatory protein